VAALAERRRFVPEESRMGRIAVGFVTRDTGHDALIEGEILDRHGGSDIHFMFPVALPFRMTIDAEGRGRLQKLLAAHAAVRVMTERTIFLEVR
jgi:hypothetical protein